MIFGRAVRLGPVFFTATFSAGCPGEPNGPPCIPRELSANSSTQECDDDEIGWTNEASDFHSEAKCQFALYPLGVSTYMETIYNEIAVAKTSPVYSSGKASVPSLAPPCHLLLRNNPSDLL